MFVFSCYSSSRISGMLPRADNNTAIGRVESNCAAIINIIINNGTLKNIPTTPHIIPQNTRFKRIANVDRFKVFPVSFGSKILPKNISKPINPTAVSIARCTDGPIASANSIGSAHAMIEPIVGI